MNVAWVHGTRVHCEHADDRGDNPVVPLMSYAPRAGSSLGPNGRWPFRRGIATLSHRGGPGEHGSQGPRGVGMLSG